MRFFNVFVVITALALGVAPRFVFCATPPGEVVQWGDGSARRGVVGIEKTRQTERTHGAELLTNIISVSAGDFHWLALSSSGQVVARGSDYYGQARPPIGSDYISAISAGGQHSLALQSNGLVVGWGDNRYGQADVPPGLTNVTAIAAGATHSLALKADGTVVAWGRYRPLPAGLTNIIALSITGSGNQERNLALRRDGSVVAWGTETIYSDGAPPQGLSNIVAVAVGKNHSLALTASGHVVGWGFNGSGQAIGVPTEASPYTASGQVMIDGKALSNVVAIAAGDGFSLALEENGTIVAWGKNRFGLASVPAGLSNAVAIAAGGHFCLAITTNAAVAERFKR
ncbi:MAG TPA: hypothetical protein VFZ59_09680 [Verrucomicrobiae bacterium]|nr:hypothetical protein [Verrucomicrobiae bacterium]